MSEILWILFFDGIQRVCISVCVYVVNVRVSLSYVFCINLHTFPIVNISAKKILNQLFGRVMYISVSLQFFLITLSRSRARSPSARLENRLRLLSRTMHAKKSITKNKTHPKNRRHSRRIGHRRRLTTTTTTKARLLTTALLTHTSSNRWRHDNRRRRLISCCRISARAAVARINTRKP